MSEKLEGPEGDGGGRTETPLGKVAVGAIVVYTIVLAVATVSEVFDLGWFDWMILSR